MFVLFYKIIILYDCLTGTYLFVRQLPPFYSLYTLTLALYGDFISLSPKKGPNSEVLVSVRVCHLQNKSNVVTEFVVLHFGRKDVFVG